MLELTEGDQIHPQLLEAAMAFFGTIEVDPTPDAVEQLCLAFWPALKIMIERGYNPEGATWKKGGWRGLLYEIRKKLERMWDRSWLDDVYDRDSSVDMINFAGFYHRWRNRGPAWGEWGEPGSREKRVGPIAMGDYSELDK